MITSSTRYNKLIISEEKWNDIISSKNRSTSLSLKRIKFNDYNLLIDEENSIIYYSVINNSKKYNPSVYYVATDNKLNIVFNQKITEDKLEKNNTFKVIIYDENNYREYLLVITNYPILNVNYKGKINNKKSVDVDLELFDNHKNVRQRVLKSLGKLKIIEENNEYSFSLIEKSLGNNKRENHISILGMEKHNEYILKAQSNINENGRYVQFFINNKYKGLYLIDYKEGSMNNFERNKANNK